MPRLIFDPPTPPEGDPPVIVIGDEEFDCLPVLPAGAWRALGSYVFSASAAHEFIEGVLVDEVTVKRWRERTSRKTEIVDNALVAQVVYALEAEYGNRPTVPSSASADGRLQTEHGSTDAPAPEALT